MQKSIALFVTIALQTSNGNAQTSKDQEETRLHPCSVVFSDVFRDFLADRNALAQLLLMAGASPVRPHQKMETPLRQQRLR
jgi:hypothetical protein